MDMLETVRHLVATAEAIRLAIPIVAAGAVGLSVLLAGVLGRPKF